MERLIYKERKNTNCEKWDGLKEKFGQEDLLPLWVADMDFEAAKCIQDALKSYVSQGTYGYYSDHDSYLEAFINWQEDNHNVKLDKKWIRYAPSVVTSINWIIQILTRLNDSIIVLTPVYYPFFNAIENNNRKLVKSELIYNRGNYEIDYIDFENKIKINNVKLFILCSPHNPIGRVWKKEELNKILEICKKYEVKVISDEIHQDIIIENNKHYSIVNFEEYKDMIVTLTSGTKTFNLASLQNSFVIIPNDDIRQKFNEYVKKIDIVEGNAFGYIAYEQAYTSGKPWLNQVLETICSNYKLLRSELSEKLPEAIISPLEGTYLAWINLNTYVKDENYINLIQKKCKLAVDYGNWFGGDKYNKFIRINLATSKDNIIKAIKQLEYLNNK
ncbi:MalY/PatB family protein [Terrisporobacter glycolicus]|uniref:cysteine-S-conjugate beta-lyase n=1 Tax=Terrisporobacter glycolicus ATCC 14880 = DSM 1288 TaxID=1121315 RepID=A0ABZ2EUW2_9FIRM|nr:MalY/PatB family protein [Terrisporobacter glycolicus]